jgi:LemA protein
LLFGRQLIGGRNMLVTQRNQFDAKWAQVDNDLKRRADLIPNLVETVKGCAKQEQTVMPKWPMPAQQCSAGPLLLLR